MSRRLVSLILALTGPTFTGCQSKPEPQPKVEAKREPVAVYTAVVTQTEWPSYYDAVGTVRARTTGQVSARMMGSAREVLVHVGDHVRAGQTLVVLDARDLEAHQRQADAGRNEALSAEAESQNATESAKANLELAEVTFRRMKDLHDKTSISNQEFDEASARMRVARANLDMAMSRQRQVQSKIAQAEEEWNSARIQSGYATVAAPFPGVVTDKMVEPGNMVSPGSPLMTIERQGAYRLEVSVEESNLGKVRPSQRVAVTLDALNRGFEGSVSEIVPAVDSASRAFIAKVDLPSGANIRSGMFGRARFATGARTVIAAPRNAIVERGQLQWLFVADGNVARGRIVTLGERSGDDVEVLSGLKAGERIVSPAPPDLTDGAKLEVRP